MKVGWQLKEELPLFLILFAIVTALIYRGDNLTPSIGTGFFVAAVITSLEVIIHAIQSKGKKKASAATPAKTKKKPAKKKTVKKKTAKKKKK